MDRDEKIYSLGQLLHDRATAKRPDWEDLSVVVRAVGDDIDISGFSYDKGGRAEPAVFTDFDVFGAISDLRMAMAEADRQGRWIASLIRINRSGGEVDGEFEYGDPDRWSIDLNDLKASADKLRPKR